MADRAKLHFVSFSFLPGLERPDPDVTVKEAQRLGICKNGN